MLVRIGDDDGTDIIDDVISELVHAESVEEESLAAILVWRKIVQDDGDERLDIEDGDRLHVKRGDGRLCLRWSVSGQGQGVIGLRLR